MSVTIRPIQPADYPLLEEFMFLTFFNPPGKDPYPYETVFHPEIIVYYEDFGNGKDDCGYVAEVEGEVIGAAWTRLIKSFGYVDDNTPELAISMKPGYQGQGIGGSLIKHLFEHLRERGYVQTSLSVDKGNPAKRLYERLGYETIQENEDDDVMLKKLL